MCLSLSQSHFKVLELQPDFVNGGRFGQVNVTKLVVEFGLNALQSVSDSRYLSVWIHMYIQNRQGMMYIRVRVYVYRRCL